MSCAIGALFLALSGSAFAQDEPYAYACENCPANWENLAIDGNSCGGDNQSPIAFDASSTRGARSARLTLTYGTELVEPDMTLTNIEWGADASASSVRWNGEEYFFSQFHFHTTAEHVINGERSDLEMHFVNKTAEGAALVIGVSILVGAENGAFEPVTAALPGADLAVVDLRALLPGNLSAYAYTGSTTTPPCSANVEWRLLRNPVELSQAQIDAIRNELWAINDGFDNNRPIQNREGRRVSTTGKANKP